MNPVKSYDKYNILNQIRKGKKWKILSHVRNSSILINYYSNIYKERRFLMGTKVKFTADLLFYYKGLLHH